MVYKPTMYYSYKSKKKMKKQEEGMTKEQLDAGRRADRDRDWKFTEEAKKQAISKETPKTPFIPTAQGIIQDVKKLEVQQQPQQQKPNLVEMMGKTAKQDTLLGTLTQGKIGSSKNIFDLMSDKVAGFAAGGILSAGAGSVIGALMGGSAATATTAASKASKIGKTISSITKTTYKSGKVSITTRYLTNPKTSALSTSLITKTLKSSGAMAGIIISAIGSYPFAHFIREEAIQTLNIPIYQAINNGDIEGAKKLTEEVETMISNKNNLLQLIPYANILNSLSDFFNAAGEANLEWRNILNTIETEGTAAEQKRKEDEKYWAQVEEEKKQKDLEEMKWKSEYYNLIREGKYEEADELLNSMGGEK